MSKHDDSVVQVRRDGEVKQTFQGENAENEALVWLQGHQSQSAQWAMKYEGWSVVRAYADGTEEAFPA